MIDQNVLKQHNISQVLLEIKHKGEMVKTQLVKQLNLSFATVSSICELLEQQGFISMDTAGVSTGGRKPRKVIFNPTARYIIAVDLSIPDTLHIALVNLNYEAVDARWIDHTDAMDFHMITGNILGAIEDLCQTDGVDERLIIGVGAAVPGIYDPHADMVHYCTNPALAGEHLKERLEDILEYPVAIMNDANLAALGQSIFTSPPLPNLLLLYFSDGIGLGIVQKGEIYQGAHGFAGEQGMVTYPTREGFKRVEDVANLSSVVRLYQLSKEQGRLASIDDIDGVDIPDIKEASQKMTIALSEGEEIARQVIKVAAEVLGWMVASLVDLLDPHVIYLGGDMDLLFPYLLPQITDAVHRRSNIIQLQDIPIKEVSAANLMLRGTAKFVFRSWLSEAAF
ncbi:MAG: ROK family transcriptional regulator [Spirochaetota bacterium]